MTTDASVSRLSLLYGILAFACMCFYFFLIYALDLHRSQLVRFGSHAFTVVVVVLAVRAFKAQTDNPISYLSGLKLGFLVSLVGSVLFAAFIFLYASFLHPAFHRELNNEIYFNQHLSPFVLAGSIILLGTIIGSLTSGILMMLDGTAGKSHSSLTSNK
ncbi:DUF4199 domain-containing protein [Hymenobacter sp. BT186]|uniref:DUF4199 domain-containing protein n=1 Tax=Hymenobacter telluris TaxID=2816474 RepID=A0A939ETL0_9BACT|nr:DUF4199 domain-containing protein [Hymenobacter telluris]MBO0356721.1 DUF4199 domain-containing protein [Hymenobacter telluris]MBW3372746.1 DUF4199 domain-containing protein [Hymenobacter norwichensis]